MKIFLDSAVIEEIVEMNPFIDGVTTNPSLLNSYDDVKKICEVMGTRPVSVEVTELGIEMYQQALTLSRIARNVVVKLPMTPMGVRVCKRLTEMSLKTNMTLVFSPNQALLAMKAGATYISPFLGRLRDNGEDAFNLLRSMFLLKEYNHFETQILVASIRTPEDVLQVACEDYDVVTIPCSILKEMFNHPLTTAGIEKFTKDWHAHTA